MKKFYFLAFLFAIFSFVFSSCMEDSPTTSEVAYNEITPFYPNGGDSGGGGGTTTGGTDTGTDNGSNPQPEVVLRVTHGKYCSWISSMEEATCIRKEAKIADPNAKTYCFGKDYYGITAVPAFEKNDTRYGQSSYSGLTDISSIFESVPTQMDGGQTHGIAILANDKAYAWGSDATVNDEIGGQSGHLGQRNTTIIRSDNYSAYKTVAGYRHSGVMLKDGRYTAFGTGTNGQLGVENRFRTLNKVAYFAPDSEGGTTWNDFRDVSTKTYHTCAIRGEVNKPGNVWCVGKNANGQLGQTDNLASQAEWYEVGITDAVQIATSANASCALHVDGSVSCWGRAENGELGTGVSTGNYAPAKITKQLNADFTESDVPPMRFITMGKAVVFGITHDKKLYSWGSNGQGQVGQPDTSEAYILKPRYTGLENITDVAVFGVTPCAKQGEGLDAKFYCTGNNDFGQATGGTTSDFERTWNEIIIP